MALGALVPVEKAQQEVSEMKSKPKHELVADHEGKVHARHFGGSFFCGSKTNSVARIFPSESMSITCNECLERAI